MKEKHRKIFLGTIVGVTSVATTLAITLPIVLQSKSKLAPSTDKYFNAILDAKDQTSSNNAALIFYGIKNESQADKGAVASAKALAKYIFESKDKNQISMHVYNGDSKNPKQVAIVVNSDVQADQTMSDETTTAASEGPWYAKFAKSAKFVILQTRINDKTIYSEFIKGTVTQDVAREINGFQTEEYIVYDIFKKSLLIINKIDPWIKTSYKGIKLDSYKLDADSKKTIAKWIFEASWATTTAITSENLEKYIVSVKPNVAQKSIVINYKIGQLEFSKNLTDIRGISAQQVADELKALSNQEGGVKIKRVALGKKEAHILPPVGNVKYRLSATEFNNLLDKPNPNFTDEKTVVIYFRNGIVDFSKNTVTYEYLIFSRDGSNITNDKGKITLYGYWTSADVSANAISKDDINKAISSQVAVTDNTNPESYTFPSSVQITKKIGANNVTFNVSLTKGIIDKSTGTINYTFSINKQKNMTASIAPKIGSLAGFQKSSK